ncbi:PREDICTED: uncharacterized protein LOC105957613 [Erythranthe guttata]|uniref:uncharacterized protein LOC105957613 n=1 Tax=Erythranthe guttata TaxID=4155 RepID=UPI00064E08FC|nr:PREDICTED: uncharacterized protein LOC105957613 [Erythranthe guttata]|eukprot:XP_012837006.1 PREDICTED: uncharacterized protein LOC105957613 [Erythranthe guttata]
MNKKYAKTGSYLFKVIQRDGEPLRDYIQRFVKAVHELRHVTHKMLAGILQQNLKHVRFRESITGRPPKTLEELLNRAGKYPLNESARWKATTVIEKKRDIPSKIAPSGSSHLKDKLLDIMIIAEQKGILQPPKRMNENPERQKSDNYCEYHRDRGHTTEECFQLKQSLKRLLQDGHLSEFLEQSQS